MLEKAQAEKPFECTTCETPRGCIWEIGYRSVPFIFFHSDFHFKFGGEAFLSFWKCTAFSFF